MSSPRLSGVLVCLVMVAGASACSGSKPAPTAATPPPVTVASVQVGIAGSASSTLAPGETRQLFATASQSDGASIDVTNLATWQSSSPSTATVSPSGVVTAAAEGPVEVSATYKTMKGSLRVDILACTVSVTPASASFNAFGGSGTLGVTVNSPSCRWTAKSDQPWFRFTPEPSGTGSGSFVYTLPPNSTPNARTANVIVTTSAGLTAAHTITEDKPLGCSYVTQPEELTFSAAGGSGVFNVITSPGDCQWNIVNTLSSLDVWITSGYSGKGNGTVRYTVQAHTRTVDSDGYIEIAGLSGLNPNGRHHVVIQKR